MTHDSRQRLRPWLIGQLDDRKIPGLEWLPNKKGLIDRTKFRIPWKHGGKHDWTPDKGKVFKEWAVHTGKYREGVDDETFARWKTNLRCALNKASDIQEVVEESQREADEPFKVYKFLPRKDKNAPHPIHKNSYTDNAMYKGSRDQQEMPPNLPAHVADYISSGSSMSSQYSRPSMASSGHMSVGRFPSDLDNISLGSMKDNKLPSLERERLLREQLQMKDEGMDFEDDSSRSSDGLPQNLGAPTHMGFTFGQPVIKTEIIDQPPCTLATQPAFIPNGQDVHAYMVPSTPQFPDQLLDYAEAGLTNNGFVGASPLNVMVTENGQPTNLSTAQSPAHFSTASSSPQQQHLAFGQPNNMAESKFSPAPSPHHYYGNSPAPSPAQPLAGTPGAASPHHVYASPVTSPQGNNDFGTAVVNQLAELDMGDANSSQFQPGLFHNQYTMGYNKLQENIDIGHPCVDKPDECSMMISVMYKNREIIRHHVTESEGCIIAFEPLSDQQTKLLDEVGLSMVKEALYATKDGRVQIPLPNWPRSGNEKLDREVDNLLKNTGRGITIECKKGDIYAKRLCKTSVYHATHFNNERCEKINRQDDAHALVKIFDYHNTYLHAIGHFEHEVRTNVKCELKPPNPDVYLFVGQNGTPSNAHTRYVVIKITSCKASKVLKSIERQVYSLNPPEISKSDSFDKLDGSIRQHLAS